MQHRVLASQQKDTDNSARRYKEAFGVLNQQNGTASLDYPTQSHSLKPLHKRSVFEPPVPPRTAPNDEEISIVMQRQEEIIRSQQRNSARFGRIRKVKKRSKKREDPTISINSKQVYQA